MMESVSRIVVPMLCGLVELGLFVGYLPTYVVDYDSSKSRNGRGSRDAPVNVLALMLIWYCPEWLYTIPCGNPR